VDGTAWENLLNMETRNKSLRQYGVFAQPIINGFLVKPQTAAQFRIGDPAHVDAVVDRLGGQSQVFSDLFYGHPSPLIFSVVAHTCSPSLE